MPVNIGTYNTRYNILTEVEVKYGHWTIYDIFSACLYIYIHIWLLLQNNN